MKLSLDTMLGCYRDQAKNDLLKVQHLAYIGDKIAVLCATQQRRAVIEENIAVSLKIMCEDGRGILEHIEKDLGGLQMQLQQLVQQTGLLRESVVQLDKDLNEDA